MENDVLLTEQEMQLMAEKPRVKAVLVPPDLLAWYERQTQGDTEAGIIKVLTTYRNFHEAERAQWL